MLTLLLILAFIAFAFGAPAKVTAITSVIILSVAFAIQALANAVSGNRPTFMEALKAIGLSFFFLLLALLFFASATYSTVALFILAINPLLIPVGLFVPFTLGFSVSLRTTLASSALIACISSIFAGLLIVGARKFLYA